MATLVAAMRVKDGVVAANYGKLKTAGKHPKVALMACMRKFLVRLNAMLATDSTWEEKLV
jgi:transposase